MKKIIVLGAGMVGSAMALDLSKDHFVTSTDISEEILEPLKLKGLDTIVLDATNETELHSVIKNYDVVFLGSSRVNNHLNPKIFNEQGYKTFNFGITRS